MPTRDFICLDCGEAFALDAADASGEPETPAAETARCPRCDSGHVRQTFASYLRNALADPCKPDLEELRSCHFG
jgi:DNA-directed RNA polymerase subunit RPC12/RpoP